MFKPLRIMTWERVMKDKAGKQESTMNLVVRFERKAPDSVGKWCLRAGRCGNAV